MAVFEKSDEASKASAHEAAAIVELRDEEQSHVPSEWHGTEDDRFQMKILGRVQETRRNFSFLTMLAFGSSLMVTWQGVLANLGTVLTNGGSAGLFWGFVVASAGYLVVYLSLAEMSSIVLLPSLRWIYRSDANDLDILGTYILWSISLGKPAVSSHVLHNLTGTGFRICTTECSTVPQLHDRLALLHRLQSAVTGIAFLVAGMIQGLFVLNIEAYVFERWHTTLLTIAVVSFCILFNTAFARSLPMVQSVLAVLNFAGLLATIIVLWVMASKTSAHDAFLEFTNNGGWSSDGMSFMVGLYPAVLYLLGFDSQVHMSEELSDAARNLPRSIMWATYFNALLALPIIITLIFTMGDVDEISASATGNPFLQVYFDTTESYAGTDILAVIVIITLTGSVIANVATASRQLWAFARDGGVPFSKFLRRVNLRLSIPLNAVMVSLVICILLSLINTGSTAALNAILGLDIASLLSSYIRSIGCLTLKRLRGEKLPPRAWTLGRWGLYVNIAALCWLLPMFVFVMFPSVTPAAADTMNYACLLFGFLVLFSTGYYLVYGRKSYISPKERLRRQLQDD